METMCVACNAPMTCSPEGGCWCVELPPLVPMPREQESCLCPTCLRERLRREGSAAVEPVAGPSPDAGSS